MEKYVVEAKVSGTAHVEVEAESAEDAIEKAHAADWTLDEWDLNTDAYHGGYIEATTYN